MNAFGTRSVSSGCIQTALAVLQTALAVFLLAASTTVFAAQQEKKPEEEPKPAPKPAAKPAAKPATKPPAKAPSGTAGSGAPAAGGTTNTAGGTGTPAAGKGPTTAAGTAGGAATTAAPKGPTTAAPGRGAAPGTPAAGRGPATATAATPARGLVAGPARVRPGDTVRRGPGGSEVHLRPNGSVRDMHARGMDIHHGPGGARIVRVERADHSRIVVERGGHGYVQRPYLYGGHEYGHRTYYRDGRVYDRFYRGYPYRGVYVEVYAPAHYYPPAFYGWAYNPWPAPVPYAWGYVRSPWYGYYGPYFTPYPVYPTASLWLTDYLISQTLAAAYQARVEAAAAPAPLPAPAGPVTLTPEVKQLISAEVQRQLALENTEAQAAARQAEPDPASSGIARILGDNTSHVFVAGSDLELVDSGGTECAITQGDVLQLSSPPPPTATAAVLVVLASKGPQECRKGSAVSVEFADLQDMQNHMRETISQGMGDLQAHQGGLPAPPASAQAASVSAPFAMAAPPPDADVAAQVKQQSAEADQAEKEALTASSGSVPLPAPVAPPGTPPATISLGQTTDQVVGSLGAPKSIVDLGPKKIYVYQDMKITFQNGKVSDVQ
jgi:hypothetical protein